MDITIGTLHRLACTVLGGAIVYTQIHLSFTSLELQGLKIVITSMLFFPKTAPHLSTDSVWYCSSYPFTSIELCCNTRHSPWTGVVRFQKKAAMFF